MFKGHEFCYEFEQPFFFAKSSMSKEWAPIFCMQNETPVSNKTPVDGIFR